LLKYKRIELSAEDAYKLFSVNTPDDLKFAESLFQRISTAG